MSDRFDMIIDTKKIKSAKYILLISIFQRTDLDW